MSPAYQVPQVDVRDKRLSELRVFFHEFMELVHKVSARRIKKQSKNPAIECNIAT